MANKNFADSHFSSGSQRDRRMTVTLYDQHRSERFPNGRPWWGTIEQPANSMQAPGTVGRLLPGDHMDPFGSTWSAPWFPHEKFFRPQYHQGRVVIDYRTMVGQHKTAVKNHYRKAVQHAHKNGWLAPTLYGPISFQIEEIIGACPMSAKIPEAAMGGDPWILGFTQTPNTHLEKLLMQAALAIHLPDEPDFADDPSATRAASHSAVIQLTPENLQRQIDAAVQAALATIGETSSPAKRAPSAAQLASLAAGRAKKAMIDPIQQGAQVPVVG